MYPNALCKIEQVRRGEQTNRFSRFCQDGREHVGRTSFSIRSTHVDEGKVILWIVEKAANSVQFFNPGLYAVAPFS